MRLAREPHEPAPFAEPLDELDAFARDTELQGRSRSPARSRRDGSGERLPDVVRAGQPFEQQHLDCAARLPPQEQPGRDDARVVHDDEMAAELLGQVAERPVADRSARAVEDEEP